MNFDFEISRVDFSSRIFVFTAIHEKTAIIHLLDRISPLE